MALTNRLIWLLLALIGIVAGGYMAWIAWGALRVEDPQRDYESHLILPARYPSALSSAIITAKPPMNPSVAMSVVPLRTVSGISSSTTT